MESSKRIKMKQMKTYTKSDFHNPEQLTRQQVGAEYRLLLPEEWKEYRGNKGIQCIFSDEKWAPCWGGSSIVTYRVPLATPLPDGTVLSSNECCFSETIARPRIYVCGKMTGVKDWNFPAFFKASEELEKQGYEAINPARMDCDCGYTLEKLKQLSPAEHQEFLKGAVKRDLAALQTCQAIAMLPGWENSKGAKAELAVAQWLGLDEVYLDEPKQPYNSDERAEWKATASPMDEYLCSGERLSDCGKLDMGDYSFAAIANYAPDDPKGAAGAKKAPMWLLPASAMRETAWVHKHGADKYGPFNWREGSVCSSTYISAIMRHLDLWRDGEDNDAESGRSHLASIAASCNILMDAMQCGTLRDDRNKLRQPTSNP